MSALLPYLTLAGAVALGLGALGLARKLSRRFTVGCFLIVGFALAGGAYQLINKVVGDTTAVANKIGGNVIGLRAGTAVLVFLTGWLVLDLRGKNGVSKFSWVLALVVPSVLPALFYTLMTVPALHDLAGSLQDFFSAPKGG